MAAELYKVFGTKTSEEFTLRLGDTLIKFNRANIIEFVPLNPDAPGVNDGEWVPFTNGCDQAIIDALVKKPNYFGYESHELEPFLNDFDGDKVIVNGMTFNQWMDKQVLKKNPLPEVTSPANPTIVGDMKPIDYDPTTPGVQVQYDQWGNVICDPVITEPNRKDVLYDTPLSDRIDGRGGDDYIVASRGGNDWLTGGEGADMISSLNASGNDVIEGNSGSDMLYAGEGNDFVYGSNRADALFGGDGHDLLVGGGGDDVIYGDNDGTSIFNWDSENGGASSNWSFSIQPGGVVFNQVEIVEIAAPGDDTIYAGSGNDRVGASNRGDALFSLRERQLETTYRRAA